MTTAAINFLIFLQLKSKLNIIKDAFLFFVASVITEARKDTKASLMKFNFDYINVFFHY